MGSEERSSPKDGARIKQTDSMNERRVRWVFYIKYPEQQDWERESQKLKRILNGNCKQYAFQFESEIEQEQKVYFCVGYMELKTPQHETWIRENMSLVYLGRPTATPLTCMLYCCKLEKRVAGPWRKQINK